MLLLEVTGFRLRVLALALVRLRARTCCAF
jgi:hypothetical protein